MNRSRYFTGVFTLFICGAALTPALRADDAMMPTVRSFAGAFFTEHNDHDFLVESELTLPIVREDRFDVSYRYRVSTPFLDLQNPQVEVLYSRFDLQADFQLSPYLRVIGVAGYRQSQTLDRHGFMAGQTLGIGIGSPAGTGAERLDWNVVFGEYLTHQNLSADWWGEAHAAWRVWQGDWKPYEGSSFQPALMLTADGDFVGDSGKVGVQYRIGPALRLLSANGNYVDICLDWYRNDDNTFFGTDENGLLGGFNFTSGPASNKLVDMRSQRAAGVLPLIWGEYDVGAGPERETQRLQMNVEFVDVDIFDHRFTGLVAYENRQEYRPGDLDNVAYSVSLGAQTDLDLASPLSHGDPLVLAGEFLHRSDHSINPNESRVLSEGQPTVIDGIGTHLLLDHGFLNVYRLRLQTKGWDLPYRDPSIYDRKTEWLNVVDWRLTAGRTVSADPSRGDFAGQLGLNWDIATVGGYVIYAHGIGSIGNETPSWQGELGVRRPVGQVFMRYESYRMRESVGPGNTFVVGFGVNL